MSNEQRPSDREDLASLLQQCCDLAEGVRVFEGEDLRQLLDTLDSIRYLMADTVVRVRASTSK